MRLEIVSAADFLVHLLRLQAGQLSERQLEMFKSSLTEVLRHRYRDHWFPDRPNRGSGYRCIRINGKMDPVIAQAGANVGLLPTVLHSLFPSELTMWIDPSEVSYRIGENGSICVLYERTEAECAEEISLQQQHHHQQQHQHQHQHHHSQQHQQVPIMPPLQQQQQQQFESCKDSLLLEHTQFSEQIAAYVSS
ncbi:PREDICTED: protein BTG2-like [Wasmannia auropunctata]|uniref:protein BTG2-like n=1 Tax=Wasmannia auropunctata TaxID=64793 RepID=UPI0005EF68B2|nr:PREDICTED: protein BTG2-like [Wasmannia auropunctata]